MNKQIEITMPDNSKTFMTMEEIDVINKKFRTASEEQIKNWLKGNPIHVTLPYIIVGTERSFYVEGGNVHQIFLVVIKIYYGTKKPE